MINYFSDSNDAASIRYFSIDGSTLEPLWQLPQIQSNSTTNGNAIARFFEQGSPNGSEAFTLGSIPSVDTSVSGEWNTGQNLEDEIPCNTQTMVACLDVSMQSETFHMC